MRKEFEGMLEIDCAGGVIYFHNAATGSTKLRICGLPSIPPQVVNSSELMDVHVTEFKSNWKGKNETKEVQDIQKERRSNKALDVRDQGEAPID